MRLCATVLLLLFAQGAAIAQWTDYGAWTSASISQKIARKTVASADFALRWDRDFTRLGSTFINTEISREVVDDLNILMAFRGGASMTDEFQWEPQRRGAITAKYKKGVGENSSVSIRLQGQTGHKGTRPPGQGLEFSQAARTKLTYYHKLSKKYRLSVSGEAFFRPLYNTYEWSDIRGRLSVRKKVAKRKYLTIGYQVESPRGGPDPWVEHVLICNFGLEKKRRKSDK